MTELTTTIPAHHLSRAARIALLSAGCAFALGVVSLGLAFATGAIALGGLGAACLLQVPLALALFGRIRIGLGNRGLDRERRILEFIGQLSRWLALGLVLTAAAAWMGGRTPESSLASLAFSATAMGVLAILWRLKQGLTALHPALALDARRTRTMVDLAALVLIGNLLGHWFSWADACAASALALRLFFEGLSLARLTAVKVACGGCSSGCESSCG